MSLSRVELDGYTSPGRLAARIHELAPDLPIEVPIEVLCRQLDIDDIQLTDTAAFEAALITDVLRSVGAILVARSSSRRRRRFSLGHELGHFLLSHHRPRAGEQFCCSLADLLSLDAPDADRHKRMEAEANRFAAQLLMPPARIRAALTAPCPDLGEIVRLADLFNVSKEAMARSYVETHREDLAIVILQQGRIARIYRPDNFPWIEPAPRALVPPDSIAAGHGLAPGELSDREEANPATWFGESHARRIEVLTEQVLGQREGYAMVLLHAELPE